MPTSKPIPFDGTGRMRFIKDRWQMKNFFKFFFRFLVTLGYRLSLQHQIPSVQNHKETVVKHEHSSFFIVAHPDDIELFMGREARHQILEQPLTKKIFIVLSAGDANRKNRRKPFREITWWEARERAHTEAIRFWDQYRHPAIESEVEIHGHHFFKITIGPSIILYNLRLTDADKTTSLDTLVQNKNQHIFDLTYDQAYSLDDIQNILFDLVQHETQGLDKANFYIMDESYKRNPQDHKDHKATSVLFRDIYPKFSHLDKNLYGYLTYFIKDKEINLQDEDREKSFATWTVIADELEKYGYKRNDDPHHMQWVGKEYNSYTVRELNEK